MISPSFGTSKSRIFSTYLMGISLILIHLLLMRVTIKMNEPNFNYPYFLIIWLQMREIKNKLTLLSEIYSIFYTIKHFCGHKNNFLCYVV